MKLKYIAVFSLFLLSLLSVLPVIAQTEKKFESQEMVDNWTCVHNGMWGGQSFTPQVTHTLTKIVLQLFRFGVPAGDFVVSVRVTMNGVPVGVDLVSTNMTAMDILEGDNMEDGKDYDFVFLEQITLEKDIMYAIVMRCPDGNDTDYIGYIYCNAPVYDRGTSVYDGDITWEFDVESDLYFSEWGYEVNPSMSDALVPFLPLLAIALALAFITLFLTLMVYLSSAKKMPIEIIVVPLFCVITLCSALLVIGIFGL